MENSIPNLIILGSGRSGTSMFTGTLANSGYFLGENSEYLGRNKSNPKGFFEDLEVNTINEDILKKSLIDIPEKIRRRFFPTYTFYRARWLSRMPLNYIPKSDIEIDQRIEKVVSRVPFCFKDPRFSYTLPVWQKIIPANTHYLVVFRHPYVTVRSIERECEESPALRKLKMSKKKAIKVWFLMYSHILKSYKSSSSKQNWFFVHYDQIFDENKISSLQSFLKIELDTGFAEKELSRAGQAFEALSGKELSIYEELNQLAHYKN